MSRHANDIIEKTKKKLEKLRNIDPFLIDLSLRENPVGARVGQTLEDKLKILPKLRDFGFKNILLGTLDYGMPEELEVDDDFMMYLRDQKIDMTGCFSFTQIGLADESGLFTPDLSMTKLRDYKVPNTIHEIYVSDAWIATMYGTTDPVGTLERSLVASIEWLNKNVRVNGKKPRIIINLVDGCDGFAGSLERTCKILRILSKQPIEGVSFEDDRGTYLPFQVGAYTEIAREILGPKEKMKLMVHMHSGAGFENASVIEALLNGADGVWAGLPKRAAVIGHASLGELLANLVRVKNRHVHKHYQIDQLLSLATTLQVLDEEERVPDDLPILGNNAYRLPLSFFQQKDEFMDLPPEAIGGKYRYRICPVVSDTGVIAGRLAEVTGCRAEEFSVEVLNQMIRLMRRDLRAGKRIVYDEPENLLALYARATVTSEAPNP